MSDYRANACILTIRLLNSENREDRKNTTEYVFNVKYHLEISINYCSAKLSKVNFE